jgi:hypothetical protein
MPLEQFPEGVRVAVSMTTQQLLIGRAGLVGLGSRRRPLISRLTWLRQRVALRRLLVRFRGCLPPPW